MAGKQGISGRSLGRMDSGFDLGAPMFLLYFNSTSTSGTSNTDVIFSNNAPFGFRIVRVDYVVAEAPTSTDDSVKVTDGTNDITDTVDYSAIGDTDFFSAGEIDDDYHEIAEGGSLEIVKTESANVSKLHVYIWCVRI